MSYSYTELKECLCCENSELRKVLDFKYQPLANSSLKNPDQVEATYPLKLNFCNNCTHLQLTHAVNPDLMFRNYLYVTGTSQTMRDYLEWFVDYTLKDKENISEIKVLDIACNDGTLLDIYKDRGTKTYGIDPSINLYDISSKNHNVDLDYLNDNHAKKYEKEFDIIVAANVMAHNDYPLNFLKICKEMIKDNGLIYIQNSQADMTKNNEFDTIYHEHLSFYSIKSFKTLAERAGLVLLDVVTVPIHGNSNIFILSTDNEKVPKRATDKTDALPLDDKVIDSYALKCYELIDNLSSGLLKIRKDGYKIIGYGSAAKGNTLINASGISLDYIIDDNPLKQGLFTPGARIPIVSSEELSKETGKICLVPLAWNFFDEIRKNTLSQINSDKLIFVKYFPEFKVIEEF